MSKLYFRADNDECCWLREDILKQMADEGISELKCFEAQRTVGEPYFWCTVNQEVGEVGQDCGRFCKQYKPRNGKNGRCRYSGHCYEPTEKSITLTC